MRGADRSVALAAHCEAGAADAKMPVRHRKQVSAGGREQRQARPLYAFTPVTQVRWPHRSKIACAITGAAAPLRCLPRPGRRLAPSVSGRRELGAEPDRAPASEARSWRDKCEHGSSNSSAYRSWRVFGP